jgi:hypothetical protein
LLGGEDATVFADSTGYAFGHTAGELYLLLIIDVTMPGNGTLLRGRLTAVAIHVAPLRGTVVNV